MENLILSYTIKRVGNLDAGQYCRIKFNDDGNVEVYDLEEDKLLASSVSRSNVVIFKNEERAKEMYKDLQTMFPDKGALMEDVIISAIGNDGFYNLRFYGMIKNVGLSACRFTNKMYYI